MNSRQHLDDSKLQRRRQKQLHQSDISIKRKLVTFLFVDNRVLFPSENGMIWYENLSNLQTQEIPLGLCEWFYDR